MNLYLPLLLGGGTTQYISISIYICYTSLHILFRNLRRHRFFLKVVGKMSFKTSIFFVEMVEYPTCSLQVNINMGVEPKIGVVLPPKSSI